VDDSSQFQDRDERLDVATPRHGGESEGAHTRL